MALIKDKHIKIYKDTITAVRQDIGRLITIYLQPITVTCPWCFKAGTKVMTSDGILSIEEILPGDFVLTKSGKFEKVNVVSKRLYSGGLIHLKPYGFYDDIVCTPNHKFFVYTEDGEVEKESKDITINDYILVSKITDFKRKEFAPFEYKQKSNGSKVTYPESIFDDPDFYRIIGLFISEGHVSGRSMGFSFHSEEIEYINFVKKFFEKHGINVALRKSSGNCTQVCMHNVVVCKWFEDNCGKGCENKHIPYYLINSSKVGDILTGIIEGDGYIDDKGLTTLGITSEELANQIFYLVNSLGYKNVGLNKSLKEDKKDVYTVSYNYISLTNSYKRFIGDKKFIKVKEISEVEYTNEWVYNLEVENEHYYTVHGFVTSNCIYDAVAKKSSGVPETGMVWSTHPNYISPRNDNLCPNCNGKGTVNTDQTKSAKGTKKDLDFNDQDNLNIGQFKPGTIRFSCDLFDVLVSGAGLISGTGPAVSAETWFDRAIKVEFDGETFNVVNVTKTGLRDLYTCRVILERTNK